MTERVEIVNGDSLLVLQLLDDNSVDAIVTDPPYGLAFMGKKWDYDVPSEELWRQCFRVLKAGGHLLCFAGTRTQHRMAVRIEDAGFEIRDMIAWVYGCLSDDTEILTQNGWERYSIFKQSSIFTEQKILIYDIQNDLYKWEKPERWNEYCVEQDTAFRIQSDNTDQIVSRGHRCLVERGGELVFVQADELAGVEQMPILRDDFFSISETHKQILQQDLPGQNGNGADIDGQQIRPHRNKISRLWNAWRKKPGMEGWRNIFQAQREIRKSINQVCSMPSGVYSDGSERRVCNGTPPECCDSDWEVFNENGVRSSYQSRCNGQPTRESNAIQNERRPQEIRTRSRYQTTLATITQIEYTGVIFCPTVSTGAFVARRNGKMFITGNSGFPKSLDVSKAIDKAAGAEREVVGEKITGRANAPRSEGRNYVDCSVGQMMVNITAPATPEAKQWQGWGTALKPALEPITVARKPLIGTVAENVLQHGTGAINVDGCRVGTDDNLNGGGYSGGTPKTMFSGLGRLQPDEFVQPAGRWPANFIHDGSEEVVGLFPETGASRAIKGGANRRAYREHEITNPSGWKEVGRIRKDEGYDDAGGSAARFFYCAKASKRDRDEGLDCIEIITIFAVWEKEEKIARLLVNMDTLQPKVTVEYTAKNKNGLEWSTLLFGKIFTEQFHSECKSITSTASNLITESKTLNVLAHYITKGYIAGVNLEQTDGGSHAENAAKSSTLILTTNEKTALALGVENAVLPTQLKINASAGQNIHSTVKPTDLMRYLCRLVTPPDGTVLDPFMGSGSTGKAAVLEGFRFIGIEREEEYCEIAKARIKHAQQ